MKLWTIVLTYKFLIVYILCKLFYDNIYYFVFKYEWHTFILKEYINNL